MDAPLRYYFSRRQPCGWCASVVKINSQIIFSQYESNCEYSEYFMCLSVLRYICPFNYSSMGKMYFSIKRLLRRSFTVKPSYMMVYSGLFFCYEPKNLNITCLYVFYSSDNPDVASCLLKWLLYSMLITPANNLLRYLDAGSWRPGQVAKCFSGASHLKKSSPNIKMKTFVNYFLIQGRVTPLKHWEGLSAIMS